MTEYPTPEIDALARERKSLPGAVDLRTFLELDFPPREWLMPELLQKRDIAMVHSWRGVGKTLFSQGIGYAVASGSPFLRYPAPDQAHGVLIVDGEMPREDLQGRLAALVAGADREATAPFRILSTDMLEDPLPSLATDRGQKIVEGSLQDVELVIIDNISTLCSSGRENEAESWEPLQSWLLSLRRRGLTVLLVHHEGKGGSQRGTSKREDVLTQVIQLKRPKNYDPSEGARFEVHLTKARGIFGNAAEPFEAVFSTGEDGEAVWTWRTLGDGKKHQVLDLCQAGVTNQREIAEELGIGLGTVNRKIQLLREEGEIE
jgi:putative DNA primase/helicase